MTDKTPSHLSADTAAELARAQGLTVPQFMLSLLPQVKELARPPISNFRVGAVALGQSGALYFGCNVEFPGQALSAVVHAEQAAVANAWHHGERGVTSLAVSAAPCGYCRQFLHELASAPTLTILLPDHPATPLAAFLPDAFGPQDLGVAGGLMAPQDHGLVLETPSSDPLLLAALEAANASYTPYTGNNAGVALRLSDGSLISGRYAENAAYSPSLSPLQAALARLVLDGRDFGEIAAAALVERRAAASQADATRTVLASIGAVPLTIALAHPLQR